MACWIDGRQAFGGGCFLITFKEFHWCFSISEKNLVHEIQISRFARIPSLRNTAIPMKREVKMSQKLSNCPDSQTLVDFLLGKLPTPEIEDCQRHVANCAPCVDTIDGLKTDDDTLDGLSRDAWIASTERNGEQDEAQVVDELINRLGELSGRSLFDTPSKVGELQDRAAEVQRVMERPTLEGDLGRIG